MDQSNYDNAKDLFLELLGWGVDPEYLVDTGLTKELIYYVFTELNLRLPNNLDTTGLLPYNPDTVRSFSFIEPDPSSPGSPKEPSPFRFNTLDVRKSSLNHQAAAAPQADLHDIEKLRRQELIARKAVQASRKAKKANNNSIAANVPSETVDDFLNSIMPAAEEAPLLPNDIPAPSLVQPSTERLSPRASPASLLQQDEKSNSSTPPLEAPPSSTESGTATFDDVMRLSPDLSSGGSTTPTHQFSNHRRGVKRPVASDFVDWDVGSRSLARSHSYDVTPNPPPPPHHTRRKTGATSFVNIPMRCVIDLSDSETDEDDETSSPSTASNVVIASPVNQAPARNTSKFVPKSAPSTGTTTPTTLEETEREIQRMKQLIAERTRQKHLKKLAVGALWLRIRDQLSHQIFRRRRLVQIYHPSLLLPMFHPQILHRRKRPLVSRFP